MAIIPGKLFQTLISTSGLGTIVKHLLSSFIHQPIASVNNIYSVSVYYP